MIPRNTDTIGIQRCLALQTRGGDEVLVPIRSNRKPDEFLPGRFAGRGGWRRLRDARIVEFLLGDSGAFYLHPMLVKMIAWGEERDVTAERGAQVGAGDVILVVEPDA